MTPWERAEAMIGRVEKIILTVLTALMIVVAFLQILLRNFLETGFSWGDASVRYLVLWVGFIGAAAAVREGKHITIDLFSQWASGKAQFVIAGFIHLFSFLVCGVLTYAAVVFTRNEAQMGGDASLLGIPSWTVQVIIPCTFALMTVRYGFLFIDVVRSALGANRYSDLQKRS